LLSHRNKPTLSEPEPDFDPDPDFDLDPDETPLSNYIKDGDGRRMSLGHEKLDVYRLAIAYVTWVFGTAEQLNGLHRYARDQWLRASQSIPLNIAEGNGKSTEADRRRYFEIARGSALECAAIQDVLVASHGLQDQESSERKEELDRMTVMLSRLGKRGYIVQEDGESFGSDADADTDFDADADFDFGNNTE